MATGNVTKPIKFKVEVFNIPTVTVNGNSYYEYGSIDVSQSGWYPIAINRIRTNKSSLLLSGFTLFTSTSIVSFMVRNVSSSAVTADQTVVNVLYCNQPLEP